MIYPVSQTAWVGFTTNASTGAAANADSLPTASLVRNGTADGAVTVTVTNLSTGAYMASFAIPADYATNDDLQLLVSATISTIPCKLWIGQGRVDATIASRSTLTALDVWAFLATSATTVGSLGKRIADFLTGDAFVRLGAPASASVSADIATVAAKTANLPASPAAVGSAMTLANNSVTAAALASDAVAEIADAVWDEALSGHTTAGSAGKALSDAISSNNIITRSGPHVLTAVDSGVDGTVGLFVGDHYSLTIRTLIGNEPPGGTGATWSASTSDEATGSAITTDASLTEISEELGYFAYALAAGDTTSARRVRLTLKRTLSSDVRIFGPLVLNVRDR
jgi:hypothetical protein